LAAELMLVKPIVIDLGWGNLKSAVVNLPDSRLSNRQNAAKQRRTLVEQYVAAFRRVEVGAYEDAKDTLKNLAANVLAWVEFDEQAALSSLVDGQMSKLH
jgi:hypothetical protein